MNEEIEVDIGPGTDIHVAQIAQMTGLHAGTEMAVLDLDEIADPGRRRHRRARPQPRERPNDRIGTDKTALQMAKTFDFRTLGNRDAGQRHDPRDDRRGGESVAGRRGHARPGTTATQCLISGRDGSGISGPAGGQ